eukprot:COSAG06_NODE_37072_length_439_cov_1.938235_1_plen_98_part_00
MLCFMKHLHVLLCLLTSLALCVCVCSHGYHLGLFRIGQGKQHPYDFDIRVPMFVRGPGITGGTRAPNVGGNVDLAPTFLDLAGVAIPPQVDGNLIYQ